MILGKNTSTFKYYASSSAERDSQRVPMVPAAPDLPKSLDVAEDGTARTHKSESLRRAGDRNVLAVRDVWPPFLLELILCWFVYKYRYNSAVIHS